MEIPLDLARTLAVVIDEGTFDAAARRLRVTPSAVSQRVKALEQQLGRVLVVRSKPARATGAGAAVVRLARQLALLEHEALAEFGVDAASDRPASVALAVNADSLGTWFLPALARVTLRHPVVFDLHRDDQDFTAGLLESGTVMGAVTSQATPVAGCLVRPLGVMRYTAVATPAFAARWSLALAGDARGADAAALEPAALAALAWRRSSTSTAATTCSATTSRRAASTPTRRRVTTCRRRTTSRWRSSSGWAGACCPAFQSDAELERGELVRLAGAPIDVPLYWQQWNLRSPLLDAIADELAVEARTALAL